MRYNVRGIPTLLLFKGGQVVAQKVGATGKSDLQKMIDPHVQASAGSVPASSTVTPSSNGAATTPSKDAATPATKDDVRVA
jgi:thioredoxin-like negative regulator of GroEL